RYGNMDELGEPGSPHPGLAWPIRARASDDACFVADKLNRRIIRMKLEYAAAESVPVGVP
ncbi:MAG: hypothetical protein N3A38_15770, partial [Planctomycetota bacterium]|nr:hypothetical protein [Planctomycetota bacterium]